MKWGMIAKIAISVAMTITGLGIALTAGTAQANPVNPAFGPISFHRAPVARRVVVEAKQIRENPGEPFAVWSGYSTFPDFTPAQKQMIRNGARGGSHVVLAVAPLEAVAVEPPRFPIGQLRLRRP